MKYALIAYIVAGAAVGLLAAAKSQAGHRLKDTLTVTLLWPVMLAWLAVHRRHGLRPVSNLSDYNEMIMEQAQKREKPTTEMRKRYGHYAPPHLFASLDDETLCAICMQTHSQGSHLIPRGRS